MIIVLLFVENDIYMFGFKRKCIEDFSLSLKNGNNNSRFLFRKQLNEHFMC